MASQRRRVQVEAPVEQVSAELMRRGLGSGERVQVVAEVVEAGEALDVAPLAQAGHAFDWLAEEPDLYTDADLLGPP